MEIKTDEGKIYVVLNVKPFEYLEVTVKVKNEEYAKIYGEKINQRK